MAAYRKNVPIREAAAVEIEDGTMCRACSPRPGPLRGLSAEVYSASAANFSEAPGFALHASANAESIVAKRKAAAAIGKVA